LTNLVNRFRQTGRHGVRHRVGTGGEGQDRSCQGRHDQPFCTHDVLPDNESSVASNEWWSGSIESGKRLHTINRSSHRVNKPHATEVRGHLDIVIFVDRNDAKRWRAPRGFPDDFGGDGNQGNSLN
jgi:hypothetical protein